MFSFFKKSDAGVKVVDKIWMSQQAKWKACAGMLAINPACLFIVWFEETHDELRQTLDLPMHQQTLVLAENVSPEIVRDRMVVFVEHYPLASVEQELFKKLNLKEVPVLLSMDEPFFEKFNGQNLIALMKKMGVKENEAMGHSMITKSIRRAQDKIASYVRSESKARSQREWMAINVR